MSKRGSVEEKVVLFFSEADVKVADAIFKVVKGIMKKRTGESTQTPVTKPRTRRKKSAPSPEPVNELVRG